MFIELGSGITVSLPSVRVLTHSQTDKQTVRAHHICMEYQTNVIAKIYNSSSILID